MVRRELKKELYSILPTLTTRKFTFVPRTTNPLTVDVEDGKIMGIMIGDERVLKVNEVLRMPFLKTGVKTIPFRIKHISYIGNGKLLSLHTVEPKIWDYLIPWCISPYGITYKEFPSKDFFMTSFSQCIAMNMTYDDEIPTAIIMYRYYFYNEKFDVAIQELESKSINHLWIDNYHVVLQINVKKVDAFKKFKDGKFSELKNSDLVDLLAFTANTSLENDIIDVLSKDEKLRERLEKKLKMSLPEALELHEAYDIEKNSLIIDDYVIEDIEQQTVDPKEAFD